MNMLIPPMRLPLTIIDAGAHMYFIAEPQHEVLVARRQMLTLGSVRYTFLLASIEIASVTLRSIGAELTTVNWVMSETARLQSTEAIHQVEDLIRNQFWGFKQWLESDVENTAHSIADWEAHIKALMNWIISPEDVAAKLKNDGGRPTPEEDMWAWEAVHIHKQPKEQVRVGWEKQLDNNTRRIVEKNNRARTFSRITKLSWAPARKKHGSIV